MTRARCAGSAMKRRHWRTRWKPGRRCGRSPPARGTAGWSGVAEVAAASRTARQRPSLRLSVVIVSHNSGPLLRGAIDSVLAQRLDGGLELILVDNASDAGKLGQLPPDQRLRLLLNPHNRGFGAACNQAGAIARVDFLLPLQ